MKTLMIVVLGLAALARPLDQLGAQESPAPAATAAASVSPTPAPRPTPIPLAEIITQTVAEEASLQETQSVAMAAESITAVRDLPAVTQEISAQLAETMQLLKPGVLLETLSDLEVRWVKLGEQLALWTRDLTNRANLIDKQIALLPDLQATWTRTREVAQASDTPPEIRQRIDKVLAEIAQTESTLQKRRVVILTEQSRVAEQSKRTAGALASIRAAQNAAVSGLLVRDSPPVWSPELREKATRDLVEGSQSSFGAQFLQLRSYVARNESQFIYLALIFGGLVVALSWVKRRAAKWTDEDPLLEQANRVLQLPIATAVVLTLLVSRPLFEEAPRLFWAMLATLRSASDCDHSPATDRSSSLPDPECARRLLPRRATQAGRSSRCPGLSRFILFLEMVGGAIFLIWFLRSTRLPGRAHLPPLRIRRRGSARVSSWSFLRPSSSPTHWAISGSRTTSPPERWSPLIWRSSFMPLEEWLPA